MQASTRVRQHAAIPATPHPRHDPPLPNPKTPPAAHMKPPHTPRPPRLLQPCKVVACELNSPPCLTAQVGCCSASPPMNHPAWHKGQDNRLQEAPQQGPHAGSTKGALRHTRRTCGVQAQKASTPEQASHQHTPGLHEPLTQYTYRHPPQTAPEATQLHAHKRRVAPPSTIHPPNYLSGWQAAGTTASKCGPGIARCLQTSTRQVT